MITEDSWYYVDLVSILTTTDSVKIVARDCKHILVEVCSHKVYSDLFPYYSVMWCFRSKTDSISKGFYDSYVKQNLTRKQYILFDLSKPFTIFSRLDDSDLSCITFTTEIPKKKSEEANLIDGSQVIFAFSRSESNIAIPSSDLYLKFIDTINSLISK